MLSRIVHQNQSLITEVNYYVTFLDKWEGIVNLPLLKYMHSYQISKEQAALEVYFPKHEV